MKRDLESEYHGNDDLYRDSSDLFFVDRIDSWCQLDRDPSLCPSEFVLRLGRWSFHPSDIEAGRDTIGDHARKRFLVDFVDLVLDQHRIGDPVRASAFSAVLIRLAAFHFLDR